MLTKCRINNAESLSLLIDCEEDWTLRAVLVGMLRQGRLPDLTPRADYGRGRDPKAPPPFRSVQIDHLP
jgi:hypothetical protein